MDGKVMLKEFVRFYCNSDNTAKSYVRIVSDYIGFCEREFGWSMDEVVSNSNKRSILTYLSGMEDRGLSPYTVNLSRSALKTFFQYCGEFDYRTKENPVLTVKRSNTSGVEQKSPYLEEDEFRRLVQATQVKTGKTKKFEFTSARDKLLLTLNLTLGLRASESLNLKVQQLESDTLTIVGKGNKLRKLRVTDDIRECFKDYMNVRHMAYDSGTQDEGYVFVTINGNQLGIKDFNKNLKKYAERAEITKDIASHALRRSCATHYLNNGVPLAQVAKALGHKNTSTTMRYYKESGDSLDFIAGLGLY